MFDVGDGGLGEQLALDRFFDAIRNARRARQELSLTQHADRLAADNRQLIAYAERLERELKVRDEQLAASQAALADARARLTDEVDRARNSLLLRMDRAKLREEERDREKAARSQQT